MKKYLLIAVFALGLTGYSCSNDSEATDKKKPNDIETSAVPAVVQSALTAKYPAAEGIKWEKAHEGDKSTFKAKFKLDGKKWKAEFNTDGSFVKEAENE